MNTPDDFNEITRLLKAMAAGDLKTKEQLIPYIEAKLQRLARDFMLRERPEHPLKPADLVYEAYLRLSGPGMVAWEGPVHFYSVAATLMRHVLIDYARRHRNPEPPPEMTFP